MIKTKAMVLGSVLVALCLLLGAKPAHAATFTVNTTGDESDFSAADGVCDTTNGGLTPCTLKAAI